MSNRQIPNHPFFADTDELEAFVSRAIDSNIQSDCDCCNTPQPNKKTYDGMYSICGTCWHENKNRAIIDIQALYADSQDVVPFNKINDFFKGYWEI